MVWLEMAGKVVLPRLDRRIAWINRPEMFLGLLLMLAIGFYRSLSC